MHDYACNNRAADFLDVNTRGSSEADSEWVRIAKQFVLIRQINCKADSECPENCEAIRSYYFLIN